VKNALFTVKIVWVHHNAFHVGGKLKLLKTYIFFYIFIKINILIEILEILVTIVNVKKDFMK
jgi:hypothetical protein